MATKKVIIDSWGDIEIEQEFMASINFVDDWEGADISVSAEFMTDTEPFPNCRKLVLYSTGKIMATYEAESGTSLVFCNKRLKQTFGEIPEYIYFKKEADL